MKYDVIIIGSGAGGAAAAYHLTQTGKRRATEILRHHRLLERFLHDVLDFSWDEVHDEAERLEHYISERLEDRIAAKLGDPDIDPHGHVIPQKDEMVVVPTVPLLRRYRSPYVQEYLANKYLKFLDQPAHSTDRYTASQLVWKARAVSRQLSRRAQRAKNPIMAQVTGRLPSLQGMCSTTTPCSAHSTRRGA